MNQPTRASLLYIVAAGLIPDVIEASTSTSGESTILSREAALLVAALRLGQHVQAMTTLPSGDVLFALSADVA
jgi:hypothetical protein